MTESTTARLDRLERRLADVEAGQHKKKRPKKKVKDSTGRSLRLALWIAIATPVINWASPYLPHVIDHQKQVLIGALAALLAKVWAEVEDRYDFHVLRQSPPTTAPVVDTE